MESEASVHQGVLSEMERIVKSGLNQGGLHIHTQVPGMLLIKDPQKDEYKEIRLQQKRSLELHAIAGVATTVKLAIDRFEGKPIVFVNRQGIQVNFDESKYSLNLANAEYDHRWTPEWLAVRGLNGTEFDLDEMREFLRVTTRSASTETSKALQLALVSVHSVVTKTAASVRTDTKHSMGRDIEAEIVLPSAVDTQSGDKTPVNLPNRFDLEVRVVVDPKIPVKQTVEIKVDIDPETLVCTLHANAEHIEAGIVAMMEECFTVVSEDIAGLGVAAECPVVYGKA